MAGQNQSQPLNTNQFELYFRRADLDQDSRITGAEAFSFLQASSLPRQFLAQIWTYAGQNKIGFIGRAEFYNALKLVTVAQSKQDLTLDTVKAAFYGPASALISAPQINLAISGSGFVPDQIFGDAFSATSVQVKQNSLIPASSASGVPVSSAIVPAFTGPQTTVRPSPLGPLQCALAQQSVGSQNQQVQSPVNQNKQIPLQRSNAFRGGAGNSASVQPRLQWK